MAQKKLGRGLGALVELEPASDDGTARIRETVRGAGNVSVLALSGQSVEEFFRAPVAAPNVALQVPPRGAAEPAPAGPLADPVPCEPAARTRQDAATATDAMDLPDDDDARAVQYSLFDPPVDDAPAEAVSEAAPEATPPRPTQVQRAAAPVAAVAPPAPTSASVADAVIADAVIADVVEVDIEVAVDAAEVQVEPVEPAEHVGQLVVDTILIDDDFPPAAQEPPLAPVPAPAAPPVRSAPAAPVAAPAAPAFDDDLIYLDESVGGIVLPDVELE